MSIIPHILSFLSLKQGVRTNEATISEILTSRTPEQLMAIKLAFTRLFDTNLEHEVSSNVRSNSLRSIYVSILSVSPTVLTAL